MPALYSGVASHPALSGKSKAKHAEDSPAFGAQQLLAEQLLGFSAPAVTDADLLELAQLAIALEVNWLYELGTDPFIYTALGSAKLNQNRSFRDDVSMISPQAQALADQVLVPVAEQGSAGFKTLRSMRGPQV